MPRAYADRPTFVFETGGTTGIPKSRVAQEDFRIDYELFSDTLPDEHFPRGGNWLMLGPSGPRRLRLAVEHLAQAPGRHLLLRGPRSTGGSFQAHSRRGRMEHLKAYQDHVIDQAVTGAVGGGTTSQCLFSTPKLLEALANRLEADGSCLKDTGITGIFAGGTEFTPQWNRFATRSCWTAST